MARSAGILVVALCACSGGSLTSFDADRTDPDARRDDGAGPPVDGGGPTVYVPDRVTMGLDLPAAVPVVRVSVGGQPIERDVEVTGSLTITENGATTHTGPIGFQGRGNFTWTLPKKGFALELQDGAGGEAPASILGLPRGADFALYACYTDKTCLRYALVLAIGQELGRWSPRARFVELYIDDDYRGLYMLLERVRRDGDRVDLPRAATTSAGDLSGGYILRHEGGGNGAGDFSTSSGVVYTFHVPEPEAITPEQDAYVRASIQGMEDGTVPIDEMSWVDRGIVEEVTNNWDGYVHSIYMTKAADADGGAWGMGPLWDFDLAFANGNVNGYSCRTDVWAYQIGRGAPDDVPAYWLDRYATETFRGTWGCRWQQLRVGALSLSTFEARIAAWTAFTADARARDQVRWPTIGQAVFPNCTTEASYEADVTYLHDWIAARLTWIDGQVTCPMP